MIKDKRTIILAAFIVLLLIFVLTLKNQVAELKDTVYMSRSRLVNLYNAGTLHYLFEEVKTNPHERNLQALSDDLLYRHQIIETMILLCKDEINKRTWNSFISLPNEQSSTYFANAANGDLDVEIVEQIELAWNQFHEYIKNDMTLNDITNPTSFTALYIDLNYELERIIMNKK